MRRVHDWGIRLFFPAHQMTLDLGGAPGQSSTIEVISKTRLLVLGQESRFDFS
jgi:hypothetical protein